MAVRIQDGIGTSLTSTASALDVNIKSSGGLTATVSGTVGVSNFPVTQPVSGTVSVSNLPVTQPVSGTITANAGTGSFTVAQATAANLNATVSGTVSISNFPASQTVAGTVSVSNFPATQAVSAASLPLPAGASTSAKQPALGVAGTPSTDVITVQGAATGTALPVSGTVSVSNFPGTQPVSGSVSVSNFPATQPVSGTVTANAGTGNFTITQATAANLNATVVGSGNFTVVQGTGTNLHTVVDSGTITAVTAITNALPTGSNTLGSVKLTDGTTVPGVIAGTTALKTDLSSVAGTATVTAAAGVQKVGLVGNAGATVDTTVLSGVAPTNAVYTASSPTSVAAGSYTTKFINASGAAVSVKASAGNLYGFSITNETAAVAYIEFFNIASAPTLGTTAVVFAVKLPASSNITLSPGAIALMNFSTGLGFAVTTTENGSTTASVTGMIFYQ